MSATEAKEDYRIVALREIEVRLRMADKLCAVEQAARRFVREGLIMNPDYIKVRVWADKSVDPFLNLCEALSAIEPIETPRIGKVTQS
jgi:hypothetical protein